MKRYKKGDWIYPIENKTGTSFFNPKQWWLVEEWNERNKVYQIFKDYKKVMLIEQINELINKGIIGNKEGAKEQ